MQEKIEKKDLLLEVAVALEDVFEAQVERGEDEITLRFENGQSFVLRIEEKE